MDAPQRDAAEDERRHRGRQVHALGEPAGGNTAFGLDGGEHVGERVAADDVDGTGPASPHQWPGGWLGQFAAVDDGARTEPGQVVGLLGAARRGMDLVAACGEQGDRRAAHASGGPRDEDGSTVGDHVVLLEGEHAEHGRVAGGANGHGLFGGEGVGEGHGPTSLHPGPLGETAPGLLADAPAVYHHPIPDRDVGVSGDGDGAGQVDAGDHGPRAHDRRGVRDRQAVLVVDRRVGDVDEHVALGKGVVVEFGEASGKAVVGPVNQQGSEHGGLLGWGGFGAVSTGRTWRSTALPSGACTRSCSPGCGPSSPTIVASTGARGTGRRRRAPWRASG